ncbi:MAG: hypothetical protein KAJ37_00545, partial [Candidatus Krumholzibacteria bacterium]|nr:hypothetical protein [Candidatus Krumholzibacteria bacterium]
ENLYLDTGHGFTHNVTTDPKKGKDVMKFRKLVSCVVACSLTALLVASCGDSDKDAERKSAGTLERIAQQALNRVSPEEEIQEVSAMIESAGYVTKEYREFPTQELGKKGRILVYTDKRGKKSGGIVYMKKTGRGVAPSWHWYFDKLVPEVVERVELNDDGLWDMRVSLKNGETLEYLQGESFSMTTADRSDWVALNGESSEPLGDEHGLWRCFDSDTSTAWRSSLDSGGKVFLELTAPFGIGQDILALHTWHSDQPSRCTLYADGKKVQEFELEPRAANQMIRLDDGVKGAKKIRLTFDSVHGGGSVVAVAELYFK